MLGEIRGGAGRAPGSAANSPPLPSRTLLIGWPGSLEVTQAPGFPASRPPGGAREPLFPRPAPWGIKTRERPLGRGLETVGAAQGAGPALAAPVGWAVGMECAPALPPSADC